MKQVLPPLIAISLLVGCGKKEPGVAGKQEPVVDIWAAAASGNTSAIEQHAGFGTDLDAREPMGGSTPLIVAALFGQGEAMKVLIENGASLDVQNNDGSTALHTAAFFCHPEAVALLLERGARSDIKNRFGRTPLESVSGEWSSAVEASYVQIAGALHLPLDLERIKSLRPQVADLIRRHDGS